MIGGPLETTLVLFGLACIVALVLLLLPKRNGGAMHKPRPSPKPSPTVPPVNDPSYDRIVVVKLDQILTNVHLLLTEVRKIVPVADQKRIDEVAARLGKSTDRLDESTAPEEKE